MPHDILRSRFEISKVLPEVKHILNTNELQVKYASLKNSLGLLNGLLPAASQLNKEGEFQSVPLFELTKSNFKTAIDAIDKIMSGDTEDPVTLRLRPVLRDLLPILKDDYAILNAADVTQDMILDDIIADGKSKIYEVPENINMPEETSPIILERDDNTLENGVFVETDDKKAIIFDKTAEILGVRQIVQNAEPVFIKQGHDTKKGVFIKDANGFRVSEAKEGDPELSYNTKNFENSAVFSNIADAQALDYICNKSRGKDEFRIRFTNDREKNTLTGITLIDNGNAFSGNPNKDLQVLPEEMGVIGETFYNRIKEIKKDDFIREMTKNGLSANDAENAFNRMNSLKEKAEKDREYFKDKAPGVTEDGRIRIVPETEWENYSVQTLAEKHPKGYFAAVSGIPAEAEKKITENKNRDVEKEQQYPVVPFAHKAYPDNPVIPDIEKREDCVKLIAPDLAFVKNSGGALSKRYRLTFREGEEKKEVFFTAASRYSFNNALIKIFDEAINQNREYSAILEDIRDYCRVNNKSGQNILTQLQKKGAEVPYAEMGYSEEEKQKYEQDEKFQSVWFVLKEDLKKGLDIEKRYVEKGFEAGQRIELKNVAASEIADVLGSSSNIAKSRVAQIESGGRIIDGVIMENADGLNPESMSAVHPIFKLNPEKMDEIFNVDTGLKSIADLQITDFVILNYDRHSKNMMYKFDEIGSEVPKFTGVIGIDNDYSFGPVVPDANEKSSYLPALNNITVISRGMADKLSKPETMELIAEKMRKNGLSEAEVMAARQRVDMINNAIKTGKMKIVEDNEWGKGDYTFQKLSTLDNVNNAADSFTSYFSRVRVKVSMVFERHVEDLRANNNGPIEYIAEKKPEFTGAKKVEEFGKNVTERKELEEYEKTAAEELKKQLEDSIKNTTDKVKKSVNDKDYVRMLEENGKYLKEWLDDVDPPLCPSSSEFKETRKACKKLEDYARKLRTEKTGEEFKLTKQEKTKIKVLLNKIADCTVAYNRRKNNPKNCTGSVTEKARINVHRLVSKKTAMLQDKLKVLTRTPEEWLRLKMHKEQAALAGAQGEKMQKGLASVIYCKTLLDTELSVKKSQKVLTALTKEKIAEGSNKIYESPAFQNLMKLPQKELKILGTERNASKLMKMFVQELGKVKKNEAEQNKNVQNEKAPKVNKPPKNIGV